MARTRTKPPVAAPEAAAPAKPRAARKAAKAKPAKPKAVKPKAVKPKAPRKAARPKAAKPKAAKPTTPVEKVKEALRKVKTIRDSFNMPSEDYALIGALKKRALAAAREAKKSELLRAGLRLLSQLPEDAFKAALAALPPVKTGRPGHKKQKD